METTDRVVFVTIDDGWDRDPAATAFLRSRRWPVTVFLIADAADRDPTYFRDLQDAGATIEDHTVDHQSLAGMAAPDQIREICDARDRLQRLAGRPVRLLRAPYGASDDITREASALCGLDALIGWNAQMDNGQLRVIGGRLRPGNIILLHFHANLAADLHALEGILAREHLQVARLEDYVPKTRLAR